MNAQVTLMQHKLLLLSPKVRNQVQEATSSQQVVKPGALAAPFNSNLLDVFDSMDAAADTNDTVQHKAAQLATMPAAYTTTVSSFTFSPAKPTDSASKLTGSNTNLPPSTIIINDPYKVYLHAALDDCGFNFLTIAKELSALCTILPLFNHNKYVESIVDPGSQVIAMSAAACHVLALIYDLHVKLCIQSMNGDVDEMLGLTRNILMPIGVIMLYVQIHIVHNLMYDILLERPFNIVLESIVHNFSNKDQTITIHNLNTGKTTMVLMFTHGTHPCTAHPSPSFCNSRI